MNFAFLQIANTTSAAIINNVGMRARGNSGIAGVGVGVDWGVGVGDATATVTVFDVAGLVVASPGQTALIW